jgi:hypothetical protein
MSRYSDPVWTTPQGTPLLSSNVYLLDAAVRLMWVAAWTRTMRGERR